MLYWILSILFLAISMWVVGLNAFVFWKGRVRKENVGSWIPLIGGTFGAIGLLLIPVPSLHAFWWIPLLIDWGSVPGIGHAIVVHSRRTPGKQ